MKKITLPFFVAFLCVAAVVFSSSTGAAAKFRPAPKLSVTASAKASLKQVHTNPATNRRVRRILSAKKVSAGKPPKVKITSVLTLRQRQLVTQAVKGSKEISICVQPSTGQSATFCFLAHQIRQRLPREMAAEFEAELVTVGMQFAESRPELFQWDGLAVALPRAEFLAAFGNSGIQVGCAGEQGSETAKVVIDRLLDLERAIPLDDGALNLGFGIFGSTPECEPQMPVDFSDITRAMIGIEAGIIGATRAVDLLSDDSFSETYAEEYSSCIDVVGETSNPGASLMEGAEGTEPTDDAGDDTPPPAPIVTTTADSSGNTTTVTTTTTPGADGCSYIEEVHTVVEDADGDVVSDTTTTTIHDCENGVEITQTNDNLAPQGEQLVDWKYTSFEPDSGETIEPDNGEDDGGLSSSEKNLVIILGTGASAALGAKIGGALGSFLGAAAGALIGLALDNMDTPCVDSICITNEEMCANWAFAAASHPTSFCDLAGEIYPVPDHLTATFGGDYVATKCAGLDSSSSSGFDQDDANALWCDFVGGFMEGFEGGAQCVSQNDAVSVAEMARNIEDICGNHAALCVPEMNDWLPDLPDPGTSTPGGDAPPIPTGDSGDPEDV